MKRYPFSLRKPEAVYMFRVGLNMEDINDVFAKVNSVMNDTGVFYKTN
jgi:hypothetical protein